MSTSSGVEYLLTQILAELRSQKSVPCTPVPCTPPIPYTPMSCTPIPYTRPSIYQTYDVPFASSKYDGVYKSPFPPQTKSPQSNLFNSPEINPERHIFIGCHMPIPMSHSELPIHIYRDVDLPRFDTNWNELHNSKVFIHCTHKLDANTKKYLMNNEHMNSDICLLIQHPTNVPSHLYNSVDYVRIYDCTVINLLPEHIRTKFTYVHISSTASYYLYDVKRDRLETVYENPRATDSEAVFQRNTFAG